MATPINQKKLKGNHLNKEFPELSIQYNNSAKELILESFKEKTAYGIRQLAHQCCSDLQKQLNKQLNLGKDRTRCKIEIVRILSSHISSHQTEPFDRGKDLHAFLDRSRKQYLNIGDLYKFTSALTDRLYDLDEKNLGRPLNQGDIDKLILDMADELEKLVLTNTTEEGEN